MQGGLSQSGSATREAYGGRAVLRAAYCAPDVPGGARLPTADPGRHVAVVGPRSPIARRSSAGIRSPGSAWAVPGGEARWQRPTTRSTRHGRTGGAPGRLRRPRRRSRSRSASRGGLTARQRAAFKAAANRWTRVIVGDLPRLRVANEVIDDVLIIAQGVPIDGPGRILGQAGPTHLRPASAGAAAFLPARGVMSFDTADLARMQASGTLRA